MGTFSFNWGEQESGRPVEFPITRFTVLDAQDFAHYNSSISRGAAENAEDAVGADATEKKDTLSDRESATAAEIAALPQDEELLSVPGVKNVCVAPDTQLVFCKVADDETGGGSEDAIFAALDPAQRAGVGENSSYSIT